MAKINYDSGRVITVPSTETTAGPAGAAAKRPVLAINTGGILKVVTGTFDFDSSYPTGGEDISDIFNNFATILGVSFSLGAAPVTINTKIVDSFPVDYTGKKVLLFGDDTTSGVPAQVANTTDASTVVGVRFIAWGV